MGRNAGLFVDFVETGSCPPLLFFFRLPQGTFTGLHAWHGWGQHMLDQPIHGGAP